MCVWFFGGSGGMCFLFVCLFYFSAFLLPLHIKSPRVLTPAGLYPLLVPSLQTILPSTHFLLHPFIVWVSSFLAAARVILQDICLFPLLPIPLQNSSITLAPYHKQLSPSSTQLGTSLFQMAGCLQWGTEISTLPFQKLCAPPWLSASKKTLG